MTTIIYDYEIQGKYGRGWELLTTEETREEAKEMLRCYDDNEPQVQHRIRKVTR